MKLPELTYWDEDDLIQAKITMAFPLRWVNSYILRDREGVTIIDPGPHTELAEQEWKWLLEQLSLSFKQIKGIVATHHHPDHYGMTGWLQERSGAPVYMSQRSQEEARRMWGVSANMVQQLPGLYARHGMTATWLEALPAHMQEGEQQVTPQPEVTLLDERQSFNMGGQSWQMIQTGGHAAGHLSFYQPERRTMLCGDAVLPQISPNISYVPGGETNPLQQYMDGLRELGKYEVTKAYPGHRNPFSNFQDRTWILLSHHEERLNRLEELLVAGPTTAFQLCIQLFSQKLTPHQMRFAMSETLAHLFELIRRGRATQKGGEEAEEVLFHHSTSPWSVNS